MDGGMAKSEWFVIEQHVSGPGSRKDRMGPHIRQNPTPLHRTHQSVQHILITL